MSKISSFKLFTEGFMDKLINWFDDKPEKPAKRKNIQENLAEHYIYIETIDDFHYKFYYIPNKQLEKKRLIARIFKKYNEYEEEVLRLYFYEYDDFLMKRLYKKDLEKPDPDPVISNEILKQSKKPFHRKFKEGTNAERLMTYLLAMWISQTRPGIEREREYADPKSNDKTLKPAPIQNIDIKKQVLG